jgi:hemerythrin-like domain-containing protein
LVLEYHYQETAMTFARQVSRALDDEHRASLTLLGRVEAACMRNQRCEPALLKALMQQLETDVTRHFEFEEQSLFPRLADAGDGDVAALLAEEHVAIRMVVDELRPLAHAALAGELDPAAAARLRNTLIELIERQVAHIQKETMALLPMLDDLLDEETDRELAFAYSAA